MTRLVAIFILCTSLISWCQDKPYIDSLNNISHSELIKNLEVSESRFIEVAAQAKILNYDKGLAEAYQHLSIINYYLKRSDQGLDYSLKAALIFEQQNNFNALANVYSDIGFVIKDINLEQGLQYFRVAIELSEKHNLLKYKEKFYNNYGILQQKVPNLDSALFYHQKSLAIAQSLSQIEAIPYSLNNIATVLSLQGNFEKALDIMDESDSLRKLEHNEFNWADNLAYRADIYFNQENYLEAVFYYKQALDIAQKTHFQNLVKFTLERLSLSYEKLDNTSEALRYQKRYQTFKDSIESVEKSVAIVRLQKEFETIKKDKEIAEKDKEIAQSKLNEEEQHSRMILLIGSLIIASGIGYWMFQRQRTKQAKLKQQVLLEKINSANRLKDEKLRISRDLHDNIGSQLTFVISSLDNLNYMSDETQRKEKLNLLASFTKSTLTELRETIWTIQSQEITVSELGAKVAQFIQQAKTTFTNIEFDLEIDSSDRKLSANEAVNSFRIIQEALNNAVKYGNPKLIKIHVCSELVFVKDNGCGFDVNQLKKGNGLANMYSRAKEIGSELVIESNESGSSIQLNFREG